jgi:hypothetical protein
VPVRVPTARIYYLFIFYLYFILNYRVEKLVDVAKYLVATIGTATGTKEALSAAVKAHHDICLPVQEC